MLSLKIAQKCFDIIKEIKPKYYLIENPPGMNKYFPGSERIDYCMYNYLSSYWNKEIGFLYIKKPTDIWTNINFNKRICDNNHYHIGLCESVRSSKERARIPKGLSLEIYNYIIQKEVENGFSNRERIFGSSE